jgi:hypothetical protein
MMMGRRKHGLGTAAIAAALVVTTWAAAARAGETPASMKVAASPSNIIAYGIAADGTLDVPVPRARITGAFPVAPTAVSNSNLIPPFAACGNSLLVFAAIIDGRFTDVAADFQEFPDQCGGSTPSTVKKTVIGSGWGQMRQIVLSSTYQYALHANGSLYRYTEERSGTTYRLKSAGSAAGYGSAKSMALVHSDARKDVLLMSLAGGALYQVTIPTRSTMNPVPVPVRTRSWNGFEQLITAPTPKGAILLQGFDRDTGVSYRYDLGPLKGAATAITSLGRAASVTQDLIVQGGTYDGFSYLGAP